ncbi:transcription initiation factor TFIID subunit 11 [Yamadazyma tenuis]|nr:uncharacterized protein CANTEDRAFT_113065 [Yamadazyma tenuis ATCC 10573]EGV65514.1 hypothetical protein CANTEDRAFT_113065 [Yamadazyma tenuis ATCC 10573]WEJ94994.1 transcription initiation factor TFIID subunit 11 [Yamadazyma tenuis]
MSHNPDEPTAGTDDSDMSDVSLDEEDEEIIGRVLYGSIAHQTDDDVLRISDDDHSSASDISDTELEQINDPALVSRYKRLREMKVDKDLGEEERKRLIMANFNNDQMDRFEAYRRSTINKPGVKKICNGVLGHSIPPHLAIILAGLSKSYLSEIITKAFEVQERENKAKLIMDIEGKKKRKRQTLRNIENGKDIEVSNSRLTYDGDTQSPLRPEHIREAIRLYRHENSSAIQAQWRAQGDADGWLFR